MPTGRQVACRDYGTSTSVPRTYITDRRGRIRYQQRAFLFKGALAPVVDALARDSVRGGVRAG